MSYITTHISDTKFKKKLIFAAIAVSLFLLNFFTPSPGHTNPNLHVDSSYGLPRYAIE